jgi:hypothetical protein
MKYLVMCPCGHALERHDLHGCEGDARSRACTCKRDQSAALEAAVDAVRSDPEATQHIVRPVTEVS